MSLDALVRSLLADVVDPITLPFQESLTHKVVTTRDSTRKPTAFSSTVVTAVHEERTFRPRLVGGVERVPSGRLTFPRPLVVTIEDQFVRASGVVLRVIEIVGPVDPVTGGRFATEVYVGDVRNA